MPNAIERWLLRSSGKQPRTTFGTEAATSLLRGLVPCCAACKATLAHHSYRFFASHPAQSSAALDAFLEAIHLEDWTAVFERQLPAINQPILVLYAISCPAGGGMTALLEAAGDPRASNRVIAANACSPASMAALRSSCPSCTWIPFGELAE